MRNLIVTVAASLLLAQFPAAVHAQQTTPAPWAGWARCQVSVQGPGYTDQQTHTWTITGGAPTVQGAFHVYAGTWAVVGGGSLSRSQGTQTLRAQWATNTPAISAPIAVFVRASDNRMFIQARHAQLRSAAAIQGFQQVTINGVPQTPGRIAAEAFEWAFPVIAVSAPIPPNTNATAIGSSNPPVNGSVGPMQPGGSQGTASCTWQFGQGSAAPAPPPTLTAQAIPTPTNPSTTTSPTNNPPGTNTPPPDPSTDASGGPAGTGARLLSITPTTVEQGGLGTIFTFTGVNTHWQAATPVLSVVPGIGIPITTVQATSATELAASLDVQFATPPGPRTVTITTGTEVVTLPNAFTVTARERPELLSVTPNRSRQGQQNLTVQLTGRATRWAQGQTRVTIAKPFDGSQPSAQRPPQLVTVLSTTVHSPTRATAVVNIAANAEPGSYWFSVFDAAPSDWLKIVDGFTVEAATSPEPTNVSRLLSVAPASIEQGVSPSDVITLTGEGTHWQQGTTTVNFGPGVTIQGGVRVNSPTSLTAQLSVAYAAAQGPRAISVTTGNEIVTLPNALTIVAREQPAITQISPNNALPGAQNVTVTFTGRGTRWEQGRTALVLTNAAGLTQAGPVSVSSPTSMTVSLSIASSATPGPREITVLNSGVVVGSDIITVADGFTVNRPGQTGGGAAVDLWASVDPDPMVFRPAVPVWAPNSTAKYVVQVMNNGPGSATGAILTIPASAGLSKTIATCTSGVGGQCPASLSVGQLESGMVIPILPRLGYVRIEFSATVTGALGSNVTVTGTVMPPAGVIDRYPTDNSLSITASILMPSTNSSGANPARPPGSTRIAPPGGSQTPSPSVSICELPGPVINPPDSSPQGAGLRWPHINGATYTVSRSDLGLLTPSPLTAAYYPATVSFTHSTPLYAGNTYTYTVQAQYGRGCGSSSVSIVPPRPFVPVASSTNAQGGGIMLVWHLPEGLTPPLGDNTGFLVVGPGLPANGYEEPGCRGRCIIAPEWRKTIYSNLSSGDHTWIIAPYWDTADGRSIDLNLGARVTVRVP